MRIYILFICFILSNILLIGQSSFNAVYTFGSTGNVESFAYNGTEYEGVSFSDIVKVGITSSSSNNNFRGSDWPVGATNASDNFTGTFDEDKYISFTVNAVPGYKFTITSISFGIGRSSTGTRQWQWRSSLDSLTRPLTDYSDLSSGLTNNEGILQNIDANSSWTAILNPGSRYTGFETSVEFRLYGYNAEATTGTAGLQGPITITGTFEETDPLSPDCNNYISTLPWYENFSGETFTTYCWRNYDIDNDNQKWNLNSFGYNSSGSILHSFSGSSQSEGWLITPQIHVPNNGNSYELKFWSYNSYPTWYHQGKNSVLISTDNFEPDNSNYTEVWSPEYVTEDWILTTINLDNYRGQDIYIAFVYEGYNAHNWYIDDISIEQLFLRINKINPADHTINVDMNAEISVEFSLNINSGNISDITIVPDPGNISATINGNILQISHAGLIPGTEYTVIIPSGAIENYNDTITWSFRTIENCGQISLLPWFEGFEDYNFPPECWTIYDEDINYPSWEQSNWQRYNGYYSAFHQDGNDQKGWLITPSIKIPENNDFSLIFYSLNENWNYGKNSVLISENSADPNSGDFEEVWSPDHTSFNYWEKIIIDLSERYAGKDIYIAFRYEGSNNHIWYIDDISIDFTPTRVIETIPFPEETHVEPNTEILVRFNVNISAFNLSNIEITPYPGNITADIFENELRINCDFLEFGTEYNVRIPHNTIEGFYEEIWWTFRTRPNCNEIITTPWNEDFDGYTFPPDCWSMHNLNGYYNGWHNRYDSDYSKNTAAHNGGSMHDDWLVSPAIEIPHEGDHYLIFQSLNEFWGPVSNTEVLISTMNPDPLSGDFVPLWIQETFNANIWEEIKINLSERFAGQTVYIAFRYFGAENHSWIIDDISISEPLSGIYTIDNNFPTENRNFYNFEDAVTALNTRKISGTTIFNVTSGQVFETYLENPEGLKITTTGTHEKQIIFQREGNGPNPILRLNGGNYNNAFTLYGISLITFDGIDIENVGYSYLENGFNLYSIPPTRLCEFINIRNCNINMQNQGRGIFSNYGDANHNSFENNNIINADHGYYLTNGYNNSISGGQLNNMYTSGIFCEHQNDLVIERVTISDVGSNSYGDSYGIRLGEGNNQKVINNLIYHINNRYRSFGIYKQTYNHDDILKLYHNTIHFGNDYNRDWSYCLFIENSKIDIRNNIFINKSNTNNSYCIYNSYHDNTNILPSTNNNIYYSQERSIYTDFSNNIYNIINYRAMLNDDRESHSYIEDVPFINVPYNFDISTVIPTKAESGGQMIEDSPVSIDINVNRRCNYSGYTGSGTAPDIGAYEFEGIRDHSQEEVPLAGIYTIDNTLETVDRNFNSFEQAISALNNRGISDSTIFNVISDRIFDISLQDNNGLRIIISGAQEKSVTFKKYGEGNNPMINISGTNSSEDACFILVATNYVTFDGIDITNTGTSTANHIEYGFYLSENCNYNTIKNCNINLNNQSNNQHSGIYIMSGNGNKFYNNNIKNSRYGYYLTSFGSNNKISGGSISNTTIAGIYNNSTHNILTIEKVKISNIGTNNYSNAYGIYSYNGTNQKFVNNLIYNIKGNSNSYGIYKHNYQFDTVRIYNNTIYLDNTTGINYCLFFNNTRAELINNIFVNKSSSAYCIYNSTNDLSNILPNSDNNIYYAANNFIYFDSNNSISSINEYRSLLNNEAENNSYLENVPFISTEEPYNFNIAANIATKAESGGKEIADTLLILTDIDNNFRFGNINYQGTGTSVDIGAYEFEGIRDESPATPALAGIYTIDNLLETSGRNFNNFEDAISALNMYGISDSVTFNVISNRIFDINIQNPTDLRIITSGKIDKPIIFKKYGEGTPPLLTVKGTEISDEAAFVFYNADFITFDGLDITNAGTSNSNYIEYGFKFLENSSNNAIKNCNLYLNNQESGIYLQTGNDNNFINNNITYARYGYYFTGNGSNNKINQGFINNTLASGVYCSGTQNNLIIENLTISEVGNNNTGNVYGIYLRSGTNQQIINNLIYNIKGRSYSYGIYKYGYYSDTLRLFHNTISLNSSDNISYCLYFRSSIMDIRNNIFINKSTSSGSYCLLNYNTHENITNTSNNNIYYFNENNLNHRLYKDSQIDIYSLISYKSIFPDDRESNSLVENIAFISETEPYNFNISTSIPTKAESGGQIISDYSAVSDINGNIRAGYENYSGNGTAPDIGAYEFEGSRDTSSTAPPLAGIYFIDDRFQTTDRYFNNFEDAINNLNQRGTSDTVIFNINSGQVFDITLSTNNGLFIITSGTPEKPIFFQKYGDGNNPLLNVTGTNASNEPCFLLYGISYITFDGIDIKNAGINNNTNIEQGFRFALQCSNNVIKNCNIHLNGSGYGIYFTSNHNNNHLINNNIKNASYGYYLYEGSQNHILGGHIDSISNRGIYCYSTQNNLIIDKVTISNVTASSAYGIYLNNGINQKITNSLIYQINGNSGSYGIYRSSYSDDTLHLFHNTIYLNNTTGYYSYCLYNTYDKVNMQNNILINHSTVNNTNCFYNSSYSNSNIISSTNNNIYFALNNGKIYNNGTNSATTLDEYLTLLSDERENRSVKEDIPFISTTYPYNFNIRTDIATSAESGGNNLSISEDINGNLRWGAENYAGNGTAPDIGAYEFDGEGRFFQNVCSGEYSTEINFSEIYINGSYLWQISNQPENITGYTNNGSEILPSMLLVNNSSNLDSVIYVVTFNEINTFEYKIFVRPIINTGNISENVFPANNSVISATSVDFSWEPVNEALFYDIYIWKESEQCPAIPTKSNLQNINYRHTGFNYGNKYKWKISAKNFCSETVSEEFIFDIRKLPDLHVTNVDISQAYAGERSTVSWTVKNDGEGATIEPLWYDYIWLVSIAEDGTDAEYARLMSRVQNTHGLNIDESYTNSIEITIPERIAGTYYIFVTADMNSCYSIDWTPTGRNYAPIPYTPDISGNPYPYLSAYCGNKNIEEVAVSRYKYDNFFYKQFEILPSPVPDLIVTNSSFPTSVFSGQNMSISWEVKNQGASVAEGSWQDVIYISPDNFWSSNARSLKNIRKNNYLLKVDSSYTVTTDITIPDYIVGEYYIFIITDAADQIYESIFEDNNTYCSPNPLTVFLTPPPDLVPDELTAPYQAGIGEQYIISYKVSNLGANPTPNSSWRDKIFICPSEIFDRQTAIDLGTYWNSTALGLNDSYNANVRITIPNNISGIWYFFVYTDEVNQVFEYTGENNNILACQHPTEILYPDLQLTSIELSSDNLYTGEESSITWKIKNIGTGNINNINITDKIFFSIYPVYNPNQLILLDSINYTLNLASGDSISNTKNIKIPCLPQATYYIYIITDVSYNVPEQNNYENNRLRTEAFEISLPDLGITEVITNESGNSGQPVNIEWIVINNNSTEILNKSVKTKFYISSESTFNEQNALILGENTSTLSLVQNEVKVLQTSYPLPNGIQGNYYIYAKINPDNLLCESNYTNNVGRSNNINILLSPWPDLEVVTINTTGTSIAGDIMNVEYIIENNGNANIENGTWTDKIYFSRKLFLDETATLLFTVNKTGDLSTGSSYTENINVRIPASSISGEYYIFIFTDSENNYYEHLSEDNNIKISEVIYITAYPLDIAALSIEAPEEANWSESITVQLNAKNISSRETLITTWFDGFYISSDSIFNQTSIRLKEQKHIGHLFPDNEYLISSTCIIPNGLYGEYYLIGVVDHNLINHDINRTNNFISKKIRINSVPTPDLIVESFEVLDAPVSGQYFRVAYTIKNQGNGNIENIQWNDMIFLSTNINNPENNDQRLSNNTKNISLFSGETYTDTISLRVPLPQNGVFILWLKTDGNNTIYEYNAENNNLKSVSISVNLPQPGDLQPTNIQTESEIISGNYIHINWDITNIENSPISGNNLRDLVYLSTDTIFDISDKLLGQVNGSVNLSPYGFESRSLTARISGVKEGYYFILVKTDAINAFNETNKNNNTSYSVSPVKVSLKELPINTPLNDSLINNLANDYKLVTDTILGETILVHLHSADSLQGAVNNIYVNHNDIADNINYIISSAGQFSSNPEVYIPSSEPDYYGINIRGETPVGTEQDIILQADILPFEIRSVTPNYGGNTGRVTTLIKGAKFTEEMAIWLEKDETFIFPDTTIYINNSNIMAVFDLEFANIGEYSVKGMNFIDNDTIAILENGFRIELGSDVKLSYTLNSPESSRPDRIILMTLEYANTGNIDIMNPVITLISETRNSIALNQNNLTQNNTLLIIPLTNEDNMNLLPPGATGIISIYAKTLTESMIFSIKDNLLR